MAIINNSLFEKASGSVDNITYYMLKGQLVARYRNRTPTDPKTPAQLAQRNKLKFSAWAYDWLKYSLRNSINLAATNQFIQNYWCSEFIPYLQNLNPTTKQQAAALVSGRNYGSSTFATIDGVHAPIGEGVGSVTLLWSTNIVTAWSSSLMIILFAYNEAGEFELSERQITLAEWNNKKITLDNVSYGNWFYCASLYDSANLDTSNVSMLRLPPLGTNLSNLIATLPPSGTNILLNKFSPTVYEYNITATGKNTISFRPFCDSPTASLFVGGSPVSSGNAIAKTLQIGLNTILITVVDNGSTTTYTMYVTK